MARKYLFLEGPEGLLNFELVALLGFLLVDSNFRLDLLNASIDLQGVPAKDAVKNYLQGGIAEVNGVATGQNAGQLLAHWGNKGNSKATIDDLLVWANNNRAALDDLMGNFKDFLNTKYPPPQNSTLSNYSQCDFKAHDVVELLESVRLMSWRRL